MLAPVRKRPRSPSPEHDITSPLDILLKRRRQTDYFGNHPSDDVEVGTEYASDGEGSSSSKFTRFKERRRTRQWEKLNAPQTTVNHPYPSSSSSSHQQRHSQYDHPQTHRPNATPLPGGLSMSQPEMGSMHPASMDISPLPRPQAYSQPEPSSSKMAMSSSPVRHHPPSSSPWRPSSHQPGEQYHTAHGYGAGEAYAIGPVGDYEPMDEEEMKREWGEEYAAQNSLLHSLHMSRSVTQSSIHTQAPTPRSTQTPDQTLLQTPAVNSPYPYPLSHSSNSYFTPAQAGTSNPMHTPSQQYLTTSTPIKDQSLAPSPSRHHSLPSSLPPYRNADTASSPFTSATLHPTPANSQNGGMEDMDMSMSMDMMTHHNDFEHGDHVTIASGKNRYEEANRLLAELALDRQRRWGVDSSPAGGGQWTG